MGVMACNRKGCDHVMCDRHSDKYGYLCCSCFSELVGLGVNADIESFMNDGEPDVIDEEESVNHWSKIFKECK